MYFDTLSVTLAGSNDRIGSTSVAAGLPSSFTPNTRQPPPEQPDALQRRLTEHIHHIREGRSDQAILTELLLKSGFPPTIGISEVSVGGKKAFKVADGRLVVCLERHLTLEAIRAIADLRPERVVCLDEGFEGNDQLKVNAAQTFKAKGVASFQTV